jgi:hypothetical protein
LNSSQIRTFAIKEFRSCRSSGVAEWICGSLPFGWLEILTNSTRFGLRVFVFGSKGFKSCNS